MSFFQVPGNGSPASYLEQAHKEKALQSMQQMSSAQIVSASAIHNKGIPLPTVSDNSLPCRFLVMFADSTVNDYCLSYVYYNLDVDSRTSILSSVVCLHATFLLTVQP